MAAKDPSIFEIFTIKSADGERTVDVSGGVINFSYFEDVYSPMVTATVLIASTGNVMTDEDRQLLDLVTDYDNLVDGLNQTLASADEEDGWPLTLAVPIHKWPRQDAGG